MQDLRSALSRLAVKTLWPEYIGIPKQKKMALQTSLFVPSQKRYIAPRPFFLVLRTDTLSSGSDGEKRHLLSVFADLDRATWYFRAGISQGKAEFTLYTGLCSCNHCPDRYVALSAGKKSSHKPAPSCKVILSQHHKPEEQDHALHTIS